MERTAEDIYSDHLRMLASPSRVQAEALVNALRDVERMHSMAHITDWQLQKAREAYASTVARDPREGAPRAPEIGDDERS